MFFFFFNIAFINNRLYWLLQHLSQPVKHVEVEFTLESVAVQFSAWKLQTFVSHSLLLWSEAWTGNLFFGDAIIFRKMAPFDGSDSISVWFIMILHVPLFSCHCSFQELVFNFYLLKNKHEVFISLHVFIASTVKSFKWQQC